MLDHAEMRHDEREEIGRLVDLFRQGCAAAMALAFIGTQQHEAPARRGL